MSHVSPNGPLVITADGGSNEPLRGAEGGHDTNSHHSETAEVDQVGYHGYL